ncbi:MAG: CHASE2 domain-containing protein [Chitinophagaceae bacterium]|nr:CHASE2 domain-containing protein [Chitinophagaceae bacterium]
MKYLFKKDTVFATIAVFIVMGLFSLIPLNTHVLDPIRIALTDISYNDLSFDRSEKNTGQVDSNIVIINVGNSDRASIANLLVTLKGHHPKVVGIDLLFLDPKDPSVDSLLKASIADLPNTVLAHDIRFTDGGPIVSGFLTPYATASGYINFIGERKGVIRHFSPFEAWKDTIAQSFPGAIIKFADSSAFAELKARSHTAELINYTRQSTQYITLDLAAMANNQNVSSLLHNKIVLIGYIGGANDIEDRHFTPLNPQFMGKSIPDMNGVVIHANIISMILEGSYINKIPTWLNVLIALLFTWIFMAYTIKFFLEHHLWYHLIMKCIQLTLTILFVYLGIIIREYLHLSASFSILVVSIILAVDVLYFYEALALWLHKKFRYQTIFNKSNH